MTVENLKHLIIKSIDFQSPYFKGFIESFKTEEMDP